ncbi:MAG: AAA family ATPase, partial [bacterium]
MAKKKEEVIELVQPRLKKLKVKNFRCIGDKTVEIELDDIVILVGPNNTGKSSIIRAYEVVMSHGSAAGKLALEDFPKGRIDPEKYPTIELVTVVGDNSPGADWIHTNEKGEMEVRERWFWEDAGNPIRQGWNVNTKDWDEKVPWGAPNVAKSRRPEPHHVSAFDSPEKQSKEITSILITALMDRIKSLAEESKDEAKETPYKKLLEAVKTIQ